MSQNAGSSTDFGRQSADSVDPDRLFSALRSRRARFALGCLHRHDDPLALADLADQVAAREHDRPLADVSAEAVKRVYVDLYHTEVPKLQDAGIVEYEQERDAIALSENAPDATALLEELAKL